MRLVLVGWELMECFAFAPETEANMLSDSRCSGTPQAASGSSGLACGRRLTHRFLQVVV
jgi:hypothetical protein